jgi:hypothetical protein
MGDGRMGGWEDGYQYVDIGLPALRPQRGTAFLVFPPFKDGEDLSGERRKNENGNEMMQKNNSSF